MSIKNYVEIRSLFVFTLCVLCLVFSGYLHTLMIVYSCLAKEKHHSVYITMRKALL